MRNRLLVLAEKAVYASDGDRGALLSVFKAMGILSPVGRGSTDAHAIDREKEPRTQ